MGTGGGGGSVGVGVFRAHVIKHAKHPSVL